MAAEFVKRDDDIVKARTEGILAHNALAADLAKLAKRVDWLEEVVGFLNCFQYGLMQACGVTDSQREIAGRIAKERYEALKIAKPEDEADLFSSIERRRRAPETKDRYEGLISVDRMMRRTGKTYKEITEMAKARGLYIVKKKGHNFVRITDEIYYK